MDAINVIVSAVVGIAAIAATVFVARRYRDRRELTYEVSITPSLLTVDEAVRPQIQVIYAGQRVSDLAGVSTTVRSVGNKSVRIPTQSEYETPITVNFGEGAEVIGEPQITRKDPDTLEATAKKVASEKVALEPMMLNPEQSVTIFALLTGFAGEVVVEGHIEDTRIAQAPTEESRYARQRLLMNILMTATLLGAVAYLVYLENTLEFVSFFDNWWIATITIVYFLALTYFVVRQWIRWYQMYR